MLCSYGFILQLRRSPTPCCAGNGTLVTRVHRVQLACERQAAQSWSIRASSLPFDFWCKLGLFDLCCLEKQSAALRAAGSLFIRKGRTLGGLQQTGRFHGGRDVQTAKVTRAWSSNLATMLCSAEKAAMILGAHG